MAVAGTSRWPLWMLGLSILFGFVTCVPGNASTDSTPEEIDLFSRSVLRRQEKLTLRIMPLGASITAGSNLNPADGYRKKLRTLLRYAGHPVNMVGSQVSDTGSMRNGAHEGYPGKRILEIKDHLIDNGFLNRKPNVVLMHMGTNNCLQDRDWKSGAKDMEDFANYLIDEIKHVTIIMSTLGRLADSDADKRCNDTLNPGIRQKVFDMQAQGKNVHLADIGSDIYYRRSDISSDGIHPRQPGYDKIAEIWYDVIQQLDRNGVITPPEETEFPDKSDDNDNTCEKVAGHAFGPVKTQFGKAGADDGPYTHKSRRWGTLDGSTKKIYLRSTEKSPQHLYFAQLINPSGDTDRNHIQDDIIYFRSANEESGDNKLISLVAPNLGGGKFGPRVKFDVDDGPGCLARGLRWGDVNNDGLDDYICIGREGNMYVSLNRGGSPPKFEYAGLYKEVPAGYKQENILLADIDGDGRLDYCATAANGDISCWRNSGTTEDKPTFWQDIGVVFEGKGMGDIRGTRFVDINGDHRSDWVWMYDDTGKTRIFTNSRGRFFGMKPFWKEATAAHAGTGQDDARNYVKFARLFPHDGGTRADYVRIRIERDGRYFRHYFDVWENLGTGGTRMKADGNHYCDMQSTGRDDLVWIKSTGEITLWPNSNKKGHLSKPWTWGESYEVLNVNQDGGNRDRRGVHFADWNGDGKCDVLYHHVDTGQVEWWRNTKTTGKVGFKYAGPVLNARCHEGIGVGLFDLGLRFADIDGDGRADWLCMEGDGRTTGYLNTDSGLRDLGQIKISEGHERANHRWADVNGDGRADFLWTDNLKGDTFVWENDGEVDERIKGSKFKWTPKGKQYVGQARSGNQYYPDLDGDGRADLHKINPDTNIGETFFNICPNQGSGQDDPDQQDPHEPSLPKCPLVCDGCGDEDGDEDPDRRKRALVARDGKKRQIRIPDLTTVIYVISRTYPSLLGYLQRTRSGPAHVLYSAQGLNCEDTDMDLSSADDGNGGLQNPLPPEWRTNVDVDHPYDLQTMALFLSYAVTGRRLNGRGQTSLQTLPQQVLADTWTSPVGLPTTPRQPFAVINDFVMDAYGSKENLRNFVPVRDDINGMKARIMGTLEPIGLDNWETRVRAARAGDDAAYRNVTTTLHEVFATFQYLNEPDVLRRLNNVINDIRTAFVYVERNNIRWRGIVDLWDEFIDDHIHAVVQAAYNWAWQALNIVGEVFQHDNTLESQTLLRLITILESQLENIRINGRARPS